MASALLRQKYALILGVVLSVVLVSIMVLRVSEAAYTATTENPGNSWVTGSVTIGDDDGDSAMFTTGTDGELTAGQELVKCITVNYTGTKTSGVTVKMFGTSSGDLAPYLTAKVEEGSGGSYANCTGFTPASTLYDGDLDVFPTTYGTGVGSWQPSGTPQNRTYRVTITVSNDNASQGKTASGAFTWEAQG